MSSPPYCTLSVLLHTRIKLTIKLHRTPSPYHLSGLAFPCLVLTQWTCRKWPVWRPLEEYAHAWPRPFCGMSCSSVYLGYHYDDASWHCPVPLPRRRTRLCCSLLATLSSAVSVAARVSLPVLFSRALSTGRSSLGANGQ